jgi:protein phosphatase
MRIVVPKTSLVVLIGPSGCGKSSFARKHFLPTEIVSSDTCRGLVADDETDQAATNPAFELLHFMIEKRLELGKLTVVDATNVQPNSRKALIELAQKYHVLPVAVVFSLKPEICIERNKDRADRQFGPHVVKRQHMEMRKGLGMLRRQGFRNQFFLDSVEEVNAAEVIRTPLWNDRTEESGPFDVIGDVHGCIFELEDLLAKLGYLKEDVGFSHPEGRRAIFVGDLVDRGPSSVGVLKLVMSMVERGTGICVPGNHDVKLLRKLKGGDVTLNHGLAGTVAEIELESEEFRKQVAEFIDQMVSHYVFDSGRLVVAHAGMPEAMQGRGSGRVRDFALYGQTTGETDEFGLPIRYKWAEDYRGKALVVYGHTPVPEVEWLNNTVCLDTGCVFGGRLSALQYPEKTIVSVEAREIYCEPMRPIVETTGLSSQQEYDDVLDINDVRGRQRIQVGLMGTILIAEENCSAALEVMSRFAANPKWLAYLPPTMSPCESAAEAGFLEYPTEALDYYRTRGVQHAICEEKHMGSRAVVVVCQDDEVAKRRFGVVDEGIGIITTRTGRRFFDDLDIEQALLKRLRDAMGRANFWDRLGTDWAIFDAELMPWNAKAQGLILSQFAPVGRSADSFSLALSNALEQFRSRGIEEVDREIASLSAIRQAASSYVEAYRRYCWPALSLDDYKLAPFHIMATEGSVHIDKNHVWHMEEIHQVCREDEQVLRATRMMLVDLTDEATCQSAVDWWLEMTGNGGEGMVVKPLDFVVRGEKGLLQPAIKCRGQEYLRIIYGPNYLAEENLRRLRVRRLGAKRALAIREFALGIEGLERFVRNEPLRRVHQCVFGVLALESEPVDPRL